MSTTPFDLITEVLIASGIEKSNEIGEYLRKLQDLQGKVISFLGCQYDPVTKAHGVFIWLWAKKPNRYAIRGNYRLPHVLDAQMSSDALVVGNCLGLTLLYNCLLRKMGIEAKALFIDYAFNIGPHVLTELPTDERSIEIENILPNGFDYRGHLDNPRKTKWEDRELVADIYLSAGNEFFQEKEWFRALESYEKAILLNPNYEKAYLNKAILLDKIGMDERTRGNS
jgi:tetratricopeptide (TPR) repeat protein